MRIKKESNNSKEIIRLKNQLEKLKKENMKLLVYNQTIETHRNNGYIPIKNHIILNRNKNNNSEIENNHRYKKIKIRHNVLKNNQNTNRIIPSAMNIANFASNQRLNNDNKLIQMYIDKKRVYQRGYNYICLLLN